MDLRNGLQIRKFEPLLETIFEELISVDGKLKRYYKHDQEGFL